MHTYRRSSCHAIDLVQVAVEEHDPAPFVVRIPTQGLREGVVDHLLHAARDARPYALVGRFVKQTVGAEIKGMTMAARIPNPWLRPLLQPLLPSLLGEKQPLRRRLFRAGSEAERPVASTEAA